MLSALTVLAEAQAEATTCMDVAILAIIVAGGVAVVWLVSR